MDEDDFSETLVPVYLREWGLSEETIQHFCDNKITVDLLQEINDFDLKELVPNIKERILFRVGTKKLFKITHDTASEDTSSAPPSPTFSDTSAPSSPTFSGTSSHEAKSTVINTQTDVTNRLEKRKEVHLAKKITCQPIVICVGSSIEALEAFYVNYDDVTYHFDTLLQAVDVCFKIFQVFDVEYPAECLQQWMFIQHHFYDITTPQDVKFPNVTSLIADLK